MLQAIGWIPVEVPEQGEDMRQEWLAETEGGKLPIMKSCKGNS